MACASVSRSHTVLSVPYALGSRARVTGGGVEGGGVGGNVVVGETLRVVDGLVLVGPLLSGGSGVHPATTRHAAMAHQILALTGPSPRAVC